MISVCMATYNGERFICEQVVSILSQLHSGDELVVSDDGSTDHTLDLLKAYNDPRIRLLQGPQRGLTYNFENAIAHARGDYLFLSDQDDVWKPNKVERMVEAMDRLNVDLVVSDATITDANLQPTGHTLQGDTPPHTGFLHTIYHTTYVGCCTAFRSTILKRLLPFPPRIVMHDYWIGQVADYFFKTAFIPDSLMYYRRHDANASTLTTGKSPLSLRQKLAYRYWIVYYLLKRVIFNS